MTFGEKLKKARKEKGLTQKELADKVGAKHNSVSNWEANQNKPDPNTIELLCGILEITPNYLLISSGTASGNNTTALAAPASQRVDRDALNVADKYAALDAHGKEAVNSILEVETARMKAAPILGIVQDEPETTEIKQYYAHVAAGSGIDLYGDDYEYIRVIANAYTRKSDYCLTVAGNSMEPKYYDEDVILVKEQDDVNFGEIGIWVINNKGYVKQKGEDRLISLNHSVPDVYLDEIDEYRCVGKVVGTLDPDWIV